MYDTLSNDYDRFVNWQSRLTFELPFIEKQITSLQSSSGQSLKILDSACGTAMHAIALAKNGHRVSAADLSAEMIVKARQNVLDAGVPVKLEAAGFGSLAKTFGPGTFDLVLCLGNSLPHITISAELNAALQDFSACLRKGGVLLIQNRNFDAVMAKKDRWMEPQTYSEGDSEWIFQRFYNFEPGGLIQFNIVTLKRTPGSTWTSAVASTHLYPQKQKELVDGLNSAGFTNVRSFGSMTGELFVPLTSGNLVLTAVKA
jgi:glycine/sarcosine N-methyltransferase